jgi:hypothetical protein
MRKIMRLLLLLPNFALLGISGYNLTAELSSMAVNGILVTSLLHLFVMALCLTFIVLIIKSAFVIRYVETDEQEAATSGSYDDYGLQHSM